MAVCDFVAVLVVGARRRGRAVRECALIWGFGGFDLEFGWDVVDVMIVVGVLWCWLWWWREGIVLFLWMDRGVVDCCGASMIFIG